MLPDGSCTGSPSNVGPRLIPYRAVIAGGSRRVPNRGWNRSGSYGIAVLPGLDVHKNISLVFIGMHCRDSRVEAVAVARRIVLGGSVDLTLRILEGSSMFLSTTKVNNVCLVIGGGWEWLITLSNTGGVSATLVGGTMVASGIVPIRRSLRRASGWCS